MSATFLERELDAARITFDDAVDGMFKALAKIQNASRLLDELDPGRTLESKANHMHWHVRHAGIFRLTEHGGYHKDMGWPNVGELLDPEALAELRSRVAEDDASGSDGSAEIGV